MYDASGLNQIRTHNTKNFDNLYVNHFKDAKSVFNKL